MKSMIKESFKFVYFFMGCSLMLSNCAYAYFDPSATTYIIQAVGALIVAAGAVFTVFRHKIAKFFNKNHEEERKEEIIVEEDD